MAGEGHRSSDDGFFSQSKACAMKHRPWPPAPVRPPLKASPEKTGRVPLRHDRQRPAASGPASPPGEPVFHHARRHGADIGAVTVQSKADGSIGLAIDALAALWAGNPRIGPGRGRAPGPDPLALRFPGALPPPRWRGGERRRWRGRKGRPRVVEPPGPLPVPIAWAGPAEGQGL
jgi:hypothetical protein